MSYLYLWLNILQQFWKIQLLFSNCNSAPFFLSLPWKSTVTYIRPFIIFSLSIHYPFFSFSAFNRIFLSNIWIFSDGFHLLLNLHVSNWQDCIFLFLEFPFDCFYKCKFSCEILLFLPLFPDYSYFSFLVWWL